MPGTTPDYWMTADDKVTATMLDVLEARNRRAEKGKGRGDGGGRSRLSPRPEGAKRGH